MGKDNICSDVKRIEWIGKNIFYTFKFFLKNYKIGGI